MSMEIRWQGNTRIDGDSGSPRRWKELSILIPQLTKPIVGVLFIMKKILFFSVISSLLMYTLAYSVDREIAVRKYNSAMSKTAPITKSALIRGDEKPDNVRYYPTHPRLAAGSPGDTLGYTQYDYQSNGSTGNRVVLDQFGGAHVAWMKADPYPSPRYVYYNYVTPGGDQGWPYTGNPVSLTDHINDGYTQISIDSSDFAAVAYHNAVVGDSLFFALDTGNGLGFFDTFSPVNRFDTEHCIWPYLTIDRNNRVHMIASETTPTAGDVQTVGYIRSADGGATWTLPAEVDTVITISPIIVSSPVSDKVAIVYTHPFDTTTQWYNDVYYIQSLNGTVWDFRFGKVNVTGYGTDADSIWAYTDCDAVYDYNDNLHILWNSQAISDSGGIYYNAQMYHYDRNSATIHEVGCAWDSLWYDDTWCQFGAWNFSMAKMSIGVDPTNNALFATYTSWSSGDCAMSTFANGDIFMQYSTNGGQTWTLRGNLTDSHTDSCLAGDCDSDHWSSLAEKVDANLHLFYVNDKDAGGVPQTEGSVTDSPMLYHRYPNPVRSMTVPNAPTLVFPYDDSTYFSAYFQFEWSRPVGASEFLIEIDDEPGFGAPLVISDQGAFCNSQYINTDSLEEGTFYWRVKTIGYYGASVFSGVWNFTVQGGCLYMPGDINGNDQANGVDVSYGVNYFKGFGPPPPDVCQCPEPNPGFAAGDVNGSCQFNGVDITYFVNYLKGIGPDLSFCPTCPPAQ